MLQNLFKYALKNMRWNAFLSLSSVLILTLLIFFINILIVVQDVSFRIISSVNERLTISLYLDEAYDKNSGEVIDLQKDIKNEIPGIVTRYKTKDEVLEDIRKTDPELVNILERQNPLPETITIENIPLQSYNTLNNLIESRMFILADGWASENYFANYSQQFERVNDLIGVLNTLRIGMYIIIATFLISIAVIVYSIIGNFIYYYRDEIYITRLVGGSKFFIYGPFSLQGMLYVGAGFILSLLLFFVLFSQLKYLFAFQSLTDIYTGNVFFVLLIECIVLLVVWGASWFFSSRRYLQK